MWSQHEGGQSGLQSESPSQKGKWGISYKNPSLEPKADLVSVWGL